MEFFKLDIKEHDSITQDLIAKFYPIIDARRYKCLSNAWIPFHPTRVNKINNRLLSVFTVMVQDVITNETINVGFYFEADVKGYNCKMISSVYPVLANDVKF